MDLRNERFRPTVFIVIIFMGVKKKKKKRLKRLLFTESFLFVFMCILPLGSYNITNVLPSAPDIAQFKQGVKSVAGKLSVLANGVMTSIQVSEK